MSDAPPATGMAWVPAATFRMGSDAHYPEEAPGPPGRGRRLLDRSPPGHQRRVRRLRGGDRLRHRRRAPARPGRLPGRPGREPRARLARVHQDPRAGRPAPPDPVVDLDAGRLLAPPRGPGVLARGPRGPSGRARRLRGREALRGLGRQGAADRGAVGARRARRARRRDVHVGRRARAARATRSRTTGTATSPGGPSPATGRPRRWARSRPTATGCSTWPATCGSGPRTGTRRATPSADCCVPHDPRGGDRAAASTRPSRSSRSRARSSRAARILCADSYCLRYRPAARRPQMVDTGMSHIGFRCVRAPGQGGDG